MMLGTREYSTVSPLVNRINNPNMYPTAVVAARRPVNQRDVPISAHSTDQ